MVFGILSSHSLSAFVLCFTAWCSCTETSPARSQEIIAWGPAPWTELVPSHDPVISTCIQHAVSVSRKQYLSSSRRRHEFRGWTQPRHMTTDILRLYRVSWYFVMYESSVPNIYLILGYWGLILCARGYAVHKLLCLFICWKLFLRSLLLAVQHQQFF